MSINFSSPDLNKIFESKVREKEKKYFFQVTFSHEQYIETVKIFLEALSAVDFDLDQISYIEPSYSRHKTTTIFVKFTFPNNSRKVVSLVRFLGGHCEGFSFYATDFTKVVDASELWIKL